jgi:hypothetical protein
MEVKMNEERKIPFVGCVRVGNFKIWKAKQRKKGNIDVDIIRISDLEGNWSVKIPQTYLAYPMIEQCFKEGNEEFLHTYIANMNLVSAIANGFYQRGVAMVGHIYMLPELLREDYKPAEGPGHADMLDEVRHICEDFLQWYNGVMKEDQARAEQDGGKSLEEDAMADKAAEILGKEEK